MDEPFNNNPALDFLSGGGEMGKRIRAFDWSKTALGAPEGWPQSLKTAVTLCLGSRFPIVIWWDRKELSQIYNDGYISFLGPAKHPACLGHSGAECWQEIWDTMGPLWEKVFETGVADWYEDFLYVINRTLPREEGYFTYSYGPIRGASGKVDGIFCACYETTERVVGARRLETLRRLGEQAAEAGTLAAARARAAAVLNENKHDVPFARIYTLDARARLPAEAIAPEVLAAVLQTRQATVLSGLGLPGGAWPEPATQAVALPLLSATHETASGIILLGVSPRRPLDAEYRTFFNLVAAHVSTAMANARAREEERKRAETLAEIDQAKTHFFSNVSHEFRTPLTLMLGPIEDLLAKSNTGLAPAAKGQLEVVHRNGLRLLRLVNTLLDFSRIEAGRVQAVFVPTDLAAFTAELASNFRAATERAGLKLTVHCPSLPEPVYVDRDMWEKVVLNLLSNAFKFTFEGEIEVTLRCERSTLHAPCSTAVLRVRDTGAGIPAEEMPRVFERFHRVPNAPSRTYEGSGIGLALVQELVKLHGGSVRAESRLGAGSTFIISVPLGKEHLPPERIGATRSLASTAVGAAPFVEEALRWLPEPSPDAETEGAVLQQELLPPPCPPGKPDESRPRLIVADDNADMRHYLARLLAEHYNVQAVADGRAALTAAHEQRPDLILSDVMMPQLDGIGLVREARADESLKTVPIILLSARAGEESRVEGLQHGADDYLIKPFSARELLARVSAHLELAQLRKQTEEALREREAWLRGQREALEAAVNGAPLPASLGVLVRTATGGLGQEARAAFYLANGEGNLLHHVVGMPLAYANAVDGFKVGPESLACGLAVHTGKPILTRDVTTEARWKPWLWLAERFGYRGCWSFPIHSSAGKFVGSLAVYSPQPREATERDLELVSLLTDTASIVIARHREAEARRQAEEALRQSEEKLRRHAEDLEKAVQERTAQLRRTVGDLEHFSYSITHDMRAPLRAMRSFASLLQAQFSGNLPTLGLDFLQRIATAADRMDQLIADALDYSKAVRQELTLTSIDPEALLRGMLQSYPAFQSPEAEIQIQGKLPLVLANQAGLTQCFSNLLNNAVKFVQPGQVPRVRIWAETRNAECQRVHTLEREAAEPPSAPRSALHVASVRIWFADNGIGIPLESQERIFDMFQRLNHAYEGTGIGLALVRKVVERMGGKVGVESEPGEGSRFWLQLKTVPSANL